MKYTDKLIIKSVLEYIMKIIMIIPYFIILLCFLFLSLIIYTKFNPSFSQEVINSFGSAILGTLIGGLITFYLTISTRKEDNTINLLKDKNEKIYSPLFVEFNKINNEISEKKLLEQKSYISNKWFELCNTEFILCIPKHIIKWMEEYNALMGNYGMLYHKFVSFCQDNQKINEIKENEKLISKNPILAYLHDYLVEEDKYIIENSEKYILTTNDHIAINHEKSKLIFDELVNEIIISDEYLQLMLLKNKIDNKVKELFEMYSYIVKCIISKQNSSIQYI